MSYADEHLGYRLTSEDEAKNWVISLAGKAREARLDCNVVFPDSHQKTVAYQRKAYAAFMMHHGSALGALMALHRCGKISDVAYNEVRQEVMATMAPTVVGVRA
jgi:hypothetical protein